MGVAIKTPHMGFPPRHYHPHARYFNNDFAARPPERSRESEQRALPAVDGRPGGSGMEVDTSDRAVIREEAAAVPEGHGDSPAVQQQEEPALKRPRTEGTSEPVALPPPAESVLDADYKSAVDEAQPGDCVPLQEGGSAVGPEAVEFVEESRAAEVLGSEGSVNIVAPPSDETPAFGPRPEDAGGPRGAPVALVGSEEGGEATNKFYCYICSITCHNQQNFQSHMNGLAHQQRMMEIQHMSNACLVTLLPRVQESLQGVRRDGEKRPGLQRWCATCQTHFTSNVMEHRRTKEHKLLSRSSCPTCTVCKLSFRSSRQFVAHMDSPEHKQRTEELQGEGGAEALEGRVPAEALSFIEAEDFEEEFGEDEEGEEGEEGSESSPQDQGGWHVQKEVTLEDMQDDEEYDPDTQYGPSFMVPVAGFLCRLCHHFYPAGSPARLTHCKSRAHFHNLQKYRASQNQGAAADAVGGAEAGPDKRGGPQARREPVSTAGRGTETPATEGRGDGSAGPGPPNRPTRAGTRRSARNQAGAAGGRKRRGGRGVRPRPALPDRRLCEFSRFLRTGGRGGACGGRGGACEGRGGAREGRGGACKGRGGAREGRGGGGRPGAGDAQEEVREGHAEALRRPEERESAMERQPQEPKRVLQHPWSWAFLIGRQGVERGEGRRGRATPSLL
ncbi:hypothetical protein ANANG_G00264220 [Anguilla anguilla]|uniref:Matrin-type domain-containing protein n=1 Tax=Anguilla anguilla TaxID=7936 RepID=A0A9D3RP45_ANGAN|nr:hypothetical protein ANANG_G00264220 [Anguilla anguilla]